MIRLLKKLILLFVLIIALNQQSFSQITDDTNFSIYYASPRKYTIADVQISGIKYLDKTVLVQLSGLLPGQEIEIPGEAITNPINKMWQQGLFSDVRITATKVVDNQIWLDIYLQERPRRADLIFYGVN